MHAWAHWRDALRLFLIYRYIVRVRRSGEHWEPENSTGPCSVARGTLGLEVIAGADDPEPPMKFSQRKAYPPTQKKNAGKKQPS